jgi:hypothetical protein
MMTVKWRRKRPPFCRNPKRFEQKAKEESSSISEKRSKKFASGRYHPLAHLVLSGDTRGLQPRPFLQTASPLNSA